MQFFDKKVAVWHRKYSHASFLFLIFISGGSLFLIFGSVFISGALQVNFIPKELRKSFEKLIQEKLCKKYSMKTGAHFIMETSLQN